MTMQKAFSIVHSDLLRGELGVNGPRTQPARNNQVVAECQAGLVLALWWSWVVGPGLALSAHKNSSVGGALRHRAAHLRSGADRAGLAAVRQNGPCRHVLRCRDYAAGGGRHRRVNAIAGTVADPGADGEQLGDWETAPPDRAATAGDRDCGQGLCCACGGQDFSRWSNASRESPLCSC